jgi:hypothetical protein
MNVGMGTVDCDAVDTIPGVDDDESLVYRNFAFFAKIIMRIRRMGAVSLESRKRGLKDFAIDPDFVKIDAYIDAWQDELPADIRVTYPADGSTPWIPSHYVGNLHSYYNLTIIMLRRPQLALSSTYGANSDWKQQMSAAYAAAKRMCRLQEAILEQYGLMGLLCMLRGINFTIYCILTCTVLHLVSPPSALPYDLALTIQVGCFDLPRS